MTLYSTFCKSTKRMASQKHRISDYERLMSCHKFLIEVYHTIQLENIASQILIEKRHISILIEERFISQFD